MGVEEGKVTHTSATSLGHHRCGLIEPTEYYLGIALVTDDVTIYEWNF